MDDTMPASRRGSDGVGRERRQRPPAPWRRRATRLIDPVLAVLIFGYGLLAVPGQVGDTGGLVLLVIVSAVLCGASVWRRSRPLIVLAVLLVAASVHAALGIPVIVADVMLLFGVHAVAARHPWQLSLPAAGAVVAWLLVTVLPRLDEVFLNVGEFVLLVVLVAWAWTWGTLVRIRREQIVGLQERADQLEREREAQAQVAVAEERSRIAREIHDLVSHSLSVVVVMSEGAAATVDTDQERARTAMLRVRDTGRNAMGEMRRMLGVLREDKPGSHAPQPGIAQLDSLVEESRAAGLPVSLTTEGEPVPLSSGLGLTVHRVVQEALTNVRKHAWDTSRVEVLVAYRRTEVEVRVTDDGRGFSGEPAGYGLVGMRERVAAYGGTLRVGMRPSGGFEVRAVLPIGDDQ